MRRIGFKRCAEAKPTLANTALHDQKGKAFARK